MTEVRYKPHHSGDTPEQRIASRLKNSGDTAHADHVVQTGHSPNRVFHNIHNSRAQQYGGPNKGEPGIDGKMRGVNNSKGQI
jgi:hypothetical protein